MRKRAEFKTEMILSRNFQVREMRAKKRTALPATLAASQLHSRKIEPCAEFKSSWGTQRSCEKEFVGDKRGRKRKIENRSNCPMKRLFSLLKNKEAIGGIFFFTSLEKSKGCTNLKSCGDGKETRSKLKTVKRCTGRKRGKRSKN